MPDIFKYIGLGFGGSTRGAAGQASKKEGPIISVQRRVSTNSKKTRKSIWFDKKVVEV
jgi:hypothetical protein